MYKKDLIKQAAGKAGLSQADTEKALNAILDTVIEAVSADDKVILMGFGTFEARQRDARVSRNPRTGEKIDVPASKLPAFKASTSFKKAVN